MNNSNEKYIGESALTGTPQSKLKLKIAEGAVTTSKLADESVTTDKLADNSVDTDKIVDKSITADKLSFDLTEEILPTVLKNINKIWNKLSDITGEPLQELTFSVNPKYYFGDDGMQVHISASCGDNNGVFSSIAFYLDGELLIKDSGVENLEYDVTINKTSVISYTANILGNEYNGSETITRYTYYWLGAASEFTSIMRDEYQISLDEGMRTSKDVVFNDGDHLFIVMSSAIKDQFIRADINGFEIPVTQTDVTLDDYTYTVFKSVNAYVAGTYNIDING